MLKKFLFVGFFGILAVQDLIAVPAEWSHSETIKPQASGLIQVTLSAETLAQAQPNFADLRLFDSKNQEVSYLLDQPKPEQPRWGRLQSLTVQMAKGQTSAVGKLPEVNSPIFIDGVSVRTYSRVVKAVTVLGSTDGVHWQTLVQNVQMSGFSQQITFPQGHWPFLKVVLQDNSQSPAVGIQAVDVHVVPKPLVYQRVTAKILESASDPRQSCLLLEFPAPNLQIASVWVETSDPLFNRRASFLSRNYANGAVQEMVLGEGVFSRKLEGEKRLESLSVSVSRQLLNRKAVLRIENGDSPPLKIDRVEAEVVPTHLIFFAQVPETYTLVVGNPQAPSKIYDITLLKESLKQNKLEAADVGVLEANPQFHPAEVLPGVPEEGSPIDVSGWAYRKKVTLQQAGLYQLTLDLPVLAREDKRFDDLRLVREGKQVPYIYDVTGVLSEIKPEVKSQSEKEKTSSWELVLPYHPLPVMYISFSARQAVFGRHVRLVENAEDERGDTRRKILAETDWVHKPDFPEDSLTLGLSQTPQSGRLTLEIDNGDNPPLQVTNFKCFVLKPRLLFKASPGANLWLYYGNSRASTPQYDLALVANEIFSGTLQEATLSEEAVLQSRPWWEAPKPTGAIKVLFWAVMILVVGALLAVIMKLLPQPSTE